MVECPYCEQEFDRREAAKKAADEPGEELRKCPNCDKWGWDARDRIYAIVSEQEGAI